MDTTENFTCEKIEKQRMTSIDWINQNDPYIVQDNVDLLELERRYEALDIPHTTRRIIDDYIACIQSRQERMEPLIYYAGRADAAHI